MLKPLIVSLVALAVLAGCKTTDPSAPEFVRTPNSISMGAAPGMTALETLANTPPAAMAPMFLEPDGSVPPRNAAGEIEIVLGAADKDSMETVRKAASVACQSLKTTLVAIKELPRRKGVRQYLYRCA